ncbi:uncharacterized protein TRIVIDRAFT_219711 [Trichoderma virens Gv29-8]|uniref:Uncharacterized protein n=1 Tax=Hypocrea virens (strain Gv29-8 / FGSC 10586) TaxID=413071 RepID=G9MLM5_HYPVG|nr:uncharacterized protein TRIVIDRAFT_219711 [Trichoderma virens Gv29-8]EHK24252.1 hypothetical protein TRIVIDRAFT_219711 [Trichoderma virens Gv29-8]UKZ54518.1 hypothetical protein TrVGV298_008326 [Trichoderma virens]
MATITTVAKSLRTKDSSSTEDAILPSEPAPAQLSRIEAVPAQAYLAEAPPAQTLSSQPPANPQTTMGPNNSITVMLKYIKLTGAFIREEWHYYINLEILLLAVGAGCLAGFLRHDANLGGGVGAAVLAVLMAILYIKYRATHFASKG